MKLTHIISAEKETLDFSNVEVLERYTRKGRYLKFDMGKMQLLRINWVTALMASAVLWSFIISALVEEDKAGAEYSKWQSWVTQNFTWLYIGTQNVWAIFLIWLALSRFGSLKLGAKDEKPAFDDYSWFAGLFACGIGVGIYYYGVSEPMYYYRAGYSNALWRIPIQTDDDRAQMAIFMTLFHWGLHGWVVYIIVALALGVVCYRWNLPMTMRWAFYPILGDLVNSILGDFIDALSIACTTFGVCTSLGFGVDSINSGLARLDSSISAGDEDLQIGLIWIITVVATGSVLLGLKGGIMRLSAFTLTLSVFLVVALLLLDNTWFLLNSLVQSVGHYFQWVIQAGFQCDTWQQLSYEFIGGEGNLLWGFGGTATNVAKAVGGAMGSQSEFYQSHAHQFMDWWTIFYWGWWISWAPFVGMFIAKISRGRTIRQVIVGSFGAPVLFSFLWLIVFGSLGIKMQRVAELALGVKPDIALGSIDCAAMGYVDGVPNSDKARALADIGYYALACRSHGDRIYDVMEPYTAVKGFLHVLVVVGVFFYFTTSSDSGSYVDDIIAAQGLETPPPIQKVFWAFTEGACATALLKGGGLSALQSASICAGLPYTFAINFLCTALYRGLKYDVGDADIVNSKDFSTQVWDFADFFPSREEFPVVPASHRLASIFECLFAPFISTFKITKNLYTGATVMLYTAGISLFYVLWIVFLFLEFEDLQWAYIGWSFYIFMVLGIMQLRCQMRVKYGVYGGVMEDFFTTLCMYPMVLSQMALHIESGVPEFTEIPVKA